MTKVKSKRLSMNIPIGVHENIRLRAQVRNITMTRYILMCIIENIVRNDEHVDHLYRNRS